MKRGFPVKKGIPAGGGGSRRFPWLFAAADIVLGCWARVRSFSDRFRVFSRVYRARASKTTQKRHTIQLQAGKADRMTPDRMTLASRQCENTMIWELGGILSAFSLTVACCGVGAWEGGGRGEGSVCA